MKSELILGLIKKTKHMTMIFLYQTNVGLNVYH